VFHDVVRSNTVGVAFLQDTEGFHNRFSAALDRNPICAGRTMFLRLQHTSDEGQRQMTLNGGLTAVHGNGHVANGHPSLVQLL